MVSKGPPLKNLRSKKRSKDDNDSDSDGKEKKRSKRNGAASTSKQKADDKASTNSGKHFIDFFDHLM